MIYCINPHCQHRENLDQLDCCQTCGTPLIIHNRYQLLRPLRPLDPWKYTDIFEVDDQGTRKVMKILKNSDDKNVELFDREALILELLNHPGIPKLDLNGYFTLSVNPTVELHCLVLEKIEGQDLESWSQEYGAISQSLALEWLRQLLEILDYLHQNQFFHRDIKPSNIMLTPEGRLVLIDFGSVREITGTYLSKIRENVEVTKIISEGYTPPEQIHGKCLPQSDFYALGRTFVHLLTNKHPSYFPISLKTGQLIWHNQAPQISKPLADFIDALMADAVVNRPQDVHRIAQALTPLSLGLRHLRYWLRSPQGILTLVTLGLIGIGLYHISEIWRFQHHLNQGQAALMKLDFNSARSNLEQSVEINPNNPKSRSNLGLVCMYQQDFHCAKKQFDQALYLNPDLEEAAIIHYNLGILYEYKDQFEQALTQYKRAMEYKGYFSIYATNNFARLQIWQKLNYELAVNLLVKALQQTETLNVDQVRKNSLQSVLYKNIGWASLEQNRYLEAQNYLKKAINLDSKQAAPHCLLAQVWQKKGDKKKALMSWRNCRNGKSGGLPEVQVWQVDALKYLGSAE